MSQPFEEYAEFYNLLYREKDYAGEAAYISDLIKRFKKKSNDPLHVLDLACGTGRHSLEFALMGYDVEGSDISAQMVAIAAEGARKEGRDIQFHNESFQTSCKLNGTFDIVVSMFAAFDYLTNPEDILISLRNIHGLLRDDGLFIFDYWNGDAVLDTYSPVKVLRKKDERGELLRVSETALDPLKQIATVKFSCLYWSGDRRVEFSEVHPMRYYHFAEMEMVLRTSGFEILHRCPFREIDHDAGKHDWSISIVARKRQDA
jgi:SAM-dependent methyltransferase